MKYMNISTYLPWLLLLLITISSSSAFADDCIEERYVFELGSGTSRVTSYQVNKCSSKVVNMISTYSKIMPYQRCISKSADKKTVDQSCINQGVNTLNEMQKLHNINCATAMCTGFATAWARNAANTQQVLAEIKDKTHIAVKVISQEEEGNIAYQVARDLLTQQSLLKPTENMLLMDVGGGSFQITGVDEDTQRSFLYKGPYGTESLTQEMKEIFPQTRPAMMECTSLPAAFEFFKKKITTPIQQDAQLAKTLRTTPDIKLYAVGSAALVGLYTEFELPNPVLKKDLEALIHKVCGMSFEKLGTLYPKIKLEYMVPTPSMLLLVHSIMEGTGKEELHLVKNANSGHYVAVHHDYWPTSQKSAITVKVSDHTVQ